MNGQNCEYLVLVVQCLSKKPHIFSFLKHINRVAAPDYIPSTGNHLLLDLYIMFIYDRYLSDDILHARIQTMGVAQHVFDVNIHGKSVTWHLYDVGGARGQRHSWVPYFDDANAIIFVAPVSAFDQVSMGASTPLPLGLTNTLSIWKKIHGPTELMTHCNSLPKFAQMHS